MVCIAQWMQREDTRALSRLARSRTTLVFDNRVR
jgi:hypothetical protein